MRAAYALVELARVHVQRGEAHLGRKGSNISSPMSCHVLPLLFLPPPLLYLPFSPLLCSPLHSSPVLFPVLLFIPALPSLPSRSPHHPFQHDNGRCWTDGGGADCCHGSCGERRRRVKKKICLRDSKHEEGNVATKISKNNKTGVRSDDGSYAFFCCRSFLSLSRTVIWNLCSERVQQGERQRGRQVVVDGGGSSDGDENVDED
eukprot:712407-Hanusia_phi.AAC.1